MKVTDIAKRSGVGAHTVRYYVRAGLLAPRRNPENNYKQFGEQDVARLHFIKGAQALGFSLGEVQALLQRMDCGECPCAAMHAQLADKILDTRRVVKGLEQRLVFMQRVYRQWGSGAEESDDIGSLCRFLDEHAQRAQLPVDPRPTLKANRRRAAAGSPGNDRHLADTPPSIPLLQSTWNSPSIPSRPRSSSQPSSANGARRQLAARRSHA